jgi:hypothetical protein
MAAAAPPPPPPPPRDLSPFDGHPPLIPEREEEWDRIYGRGRPVAILTVAQPNVVLRYQGFYNGKVLLEAAVEEGPWEWETPWDDTIDMIDTFRVEYSPLHGWCVFYKSGTRRGVTRIGFHDGYQRANRGAMVRVHPLLPPIMPHLVLHPDFARDAVRYTLPARFRHLDRHSGASALARQRVMALMLANRRSNLATAGGEARGELPWLPPEMIEMLLSMIRMHELEQ